jgi:Cu-processing system ATP-binding protein
MIAFQQFSKRFGTTTAVAEITFEAQAGDIVALLGPNGSGKTTSIKAAAGPIRPSSGAVRIGEPGRPSTDPSARAACAFLPQHVQFPGALTGHEVLDLYRRMRGYPPARVRDIAATVGLSGALARPVRTYSGGMAQRLGLAVALLPASPVLLLDEPTASLDPEGIRTFYEAIEIGRARRQTVLFSSHQMGDVERLADRFVIVASGRLVASFTARELTSRLADRGVLTIAMTRRTPALLDAVRRIAPAAAFVADRLVVPAPTARRLEVLDLVRASGVEIRGWNAQDGRLDAFYTELIGGAA